MGDSSKKHHHQNPKRKKKKGRPPSLPTAASPSPNPTLRRRSTRQNPLPSHSPPEPDAAAAAPAPDDDEEDDSDSGRRRREKKLKLVLRMPNSVQDPSGSDGEGEGEGPSKKRRINAVGVGRGSDGGKGDARNSPWKGTPSKSAEAALDSGPTSSLPDKKLLIFILDRIQKKDTYGVFSEPVDPEELPDYHDLIEHPMDFGTVRNKLSSGAYANLEQFEKDVFLICSNAMRYNAPDTIYYRQARSMQEVARKNFENLRQGGEGNEPEVKVVRRGRPPGKTSIKKQLGYLSVERAGSEATLASIADSKLNVTHESLRKGADKSGTNDVFAKNRNSEAVGYAAENKSDRNDELSGFMLKGMSKFFKKPMVLDENRRDTYNLSLQSPWDREPSVTTIFQHERKQLIPVGLYGEHTYARSLARFAANLGPVAWTAASKKIERALPSGMKFGPGWVGESECSQVPQPPLFANSSYQSLQPTDTSQQLCQTRSSNCSSVPTLPVAKTDKLLVPHGSSTNADATDISRYPQQITSSGQSRHSGAMADPKSSTQNLEAQYNACNSNSALLSRPNSQRQNFPTHSPINGYYGYVPNSLPLSGKPSSLGGPTPGGSLHSEAGAVSGNVDIANIDTNSFLRGIPSSQVDGIQTPMNCRRPIPDPRHVGKVYASQGMLPLSNSDVVPPDLNVRFQTPNSPGSGGVMVDSKQPDLALQL